jgi:DNA-binding transcriptional ArsR family regulator
MTKLLDDRLDATFAALASSTRRTILARLAEGEATVTELAEPFDMSLPAVSKHLKVLEEAHLIQRGRRAQFRPCVLDPQALDAAIGWAATCREVWNARFDRIEAHLARTAEEDQK